MDIGSQQRVIIVEPLDLASRANQPDETANPAGADGLPTPERVDLPGGRQRAPMEGSNSDA